MTIVRDALHVYFYMEISPEKVCLSACRRASCWYLCRAEGRGSLRSEEFPFHVYFLFSFYQIYIRARMMKEDDIHGRTLE